MGFQQITGMRCLLCSILLILLVSSYGAAFEADETQEEEDHVLVLDASNFSEAIETHPFIVVEFYAPWCGHCKKLAPEYKKAASVLKNNDPPIILAKIDANDELNKPLASEYNVHGFPTLKIVQHKGGSVRDFKGPRHAEGIVSYLKKQAGPSSLEITSAEQGATLVEQSDIIIVGIFSVYECEEFKNFTTVANELRGDFDFGHTLDGSFLPSKSVALSTPMIRVYKKFDEGFSDIKDFYPEKVKSFLDEVSIPRVVLLNEDPIQRAFIGKIFSNPSVTKVGLFIDFKADDIEDFKVAYSKLAEDYTAKGLRFLMVEMEEDQRFAQYFGVSKERTPCLAVQGIDKKKYVLEKAEVSQLGPWLQDYFDGKVPEFIKSEPVPEKNDGPVKVVVADSFEDMVLKSGKNVLIEFYAPWCGHCKKLAPIYEEIGIAFQGDPDVVIAKYDATANDITHQSFTVKGYPTLYFHSAVGVVIPYTGNRSKEDIINFINESKYSLERDDVIEKRVVDSERTKDEL